MIQDNSPLWSPSNDLTAQSNMLRYLKWLRQEKQLDFENYDALWSWSVEHIADFWESLWQFCAIHSHTPFTSVLKKPAVGMIGTKWFTGATVNYAEHIFRNKTNSRPAILFNLKSLLYRKFHGRNWKMGLPVWLPG